MFFLSYLYSVLFYTRGRLLPPLSISLPPPPLPLSL